MPGTDSFGQGVNLALLSDAPDAQQLAADLANGIIPRTIMRFASASNRGATLTSPVEGMVTYLADSDTLEFWTGSAWRPLYGYSQTYVPVWSGTTTNPTLGNGTMAGTYTRLGRFIHGFVTITWGSTTNPGAGIWRWTLPTPAVLGQVGGTLSVLRNSAADLSGVLMPGDAPAGTRVQAVAPGGTGDWGAATATLASNDMVYLAFHYLEA